MLCYLWGSSDEKNIAHLKRTSKQQQCNLSYFARHARTACTHQRLSLLLVSSRLVSTTSCFTCTKLTHFEWKQWDRARFRATPCVVLSEGARKAHATASSSEATPVSFICILLTTFELQISPCLSSHYRLHIE